MADYRDYGYINPPAPLVEVDTIRYGQVYQATHDGRGKRLSLMNRSFISFLYGNKHIEDFNLIATIDNNRIDRSLYSTFKDNVTTYNNLDGQYYWGTHYEAFKLDLILSTDGIDQRQLDEFKYWFQAGITRELILAEHPNRAILARVESAPRMSLLPFETTVEFSLGTSIPYHTSTTLYKGDINISFVSDSPHWYAVTNILGKKEGDYYKDKWKAPGLPDIEENYIEISESPDALKILYEDGIPLGSNIDASMLLGNGAYAIIGTRPICRIWSEEANFADIVWTNGVPEGDGARIHGTVPPTNTIELNSSAPILSANGEYEGRLDGALIDATGAGVQGFTPGPGSSIYFYYSGTAPAYTEISFTCAPLFNNEKYISTPANSFAPYIFNFKSYPYSTITIESQTAQHLDLTTPNIYTSYNTTIKLINDYWGNATAEWEDLFRALREEVHHLAVRAWATAVLTYIQSKDNTVVRPSQLPSYKNSALTYLAYFFTKSSDLADTYDASFSFNSETGKAVGVFTYRTLMSSLPENDNAWATYGISATTVEEDVGDMLRSNYIIIRERNYPSTSGKIIGWSDQTDNGVTQSHRIYHNLLVPLDNFQIKYKNMYL